MGDLFPPGVASAAAQRAVAEQGTMFFGSLALRPGPSRECDITFFVKGWESLGPLQNRKTPRTSKIGQTYVKMPQIFDFGYFGCILVLFACGGVFLFCRGPSSSQVKGRRKLAQLRDSTVAARGGCKVSPYRHPVAAIMVREGNQRDSSRCCLGEVKNSAYSPYKAIEKGRPSSPT